MLSELSSLCSRVRLLLFANTRDHQVVVHADGYGPHKQGATATLQHYNYDLKHFLFRINEEANFTKMWPYGRRPRSRCSGKRERHCTGRCD
ncbi:hypothetical protein EVAR_35306_1 [Eumeta japonica]|uniref:Uncharacterized protein n=1 Tax=Eumeta variegata TaxID=151549 RepID=A0A4C1XHP4_EUMVA|nr:hypothetical protein EVAR_35306_1 [Eumeta japonica]